MSTSTAHGIASAQVSAVIIRADGAREELGVISYWHKNPFRRLLWRLKNRKG